MSVERDPSGRFLARKRTRIITIFDRYNIFKSCRETTTILYAGHVCSLLGTRSSFALSILIKSLTYKSFQIPLQKKKMRARLSYSRAAPRSGIVNKKVPDWDYFIEDKRKLRIFVRGEGQKALVGKKMRKREKEERRRERKV